MEFNGWSSFEDLARACGYSNNNSNDNRCGDIPNGFQSLSPDLFIVIGEILGNIAAGNLPFNVQNAIGNWLQLVGQVILTYNAQQQYFQGGPGRYFDYKYYNVSNPFCSTTSTNNSSNNDNKTSNKSNEKDSTSDNNMKSNDDKIKALELRLNQLTDELEKIRTLIEK